MGAGQLVRHDMKQEFTAQDTFEKLKRIPLDIDFVNFKSIDMEDVFGADHPDYCDAFISYAEFKNGVELNDDQLGELNENSDIVYQAVMDHLY